MSKLTNKIGPPVEGDDFFGRTKELLEGWQEVESGNHLLIIAPRRVGKSSYAKKLVRDVQDKGWKGVFIDVQEVTTEVGFFETFSAKVREINKSWFRKGLTKTHDIMNAVLEQIKIEWQTDAGKISLGLGGSHRTELQASLDKVLEDAGDFLIAIDELPYFLARLEKEDNGPRRISDFLHMLRALRQKSGNKVRWLFCGSIGLDTFAGRHKLSSTLNDLLPFDLAAFDNPTAHAFLEKLGKDTKMPLNEEQIDYMLQLIGWPLPFFLQAHFGQLKRLVQSDGKAINPATIEEAYHNIVRDLSALRTWDERLEGQLPEQANFCRSILIEICQRKQGLERSKIFDLLYNTNEDPQKIENKLSTSLEMLRHDGYLLLDEGRYIFRSPLIRDYWYEFHVR